MSSPQSVTARHRRNATAALACLLAIALASSAFSQTSEPTKTVEEFAARLSNARSVEAGVALLADQPALVTPELQRALLTQAEAHYAARRQAAAAISFALMQRIAERLNDARGNALAWHRLGLVTTDMGKVEQAFAAYRQALKLRESLGESKLIAATLTNLGYLHRQMGEMDEANALLQRALQLCEQSGDAVAIVTALFSLALIPTDLSDFARAAELFQRALGLCDSAAEYQACRPRALFGLGNLARRRGQAETALAYYRECLSLSEAQQNENGMAYALNALGLMSMGQGDLRNALAYFQRSLALKEKTNDRPAQTNTLINLGQVYYRQSNVELARSYAERALQLAETLKLPAQIVSARNNLANLLHDTQRFAEAQTLYESNLALARTMRSLSLQASSLNNLGRLQLHQGHPAEAITLMQEALDLAERGDPLGRITTLNDLSDAHFAAGHYAESLAAAERAAAAATQADKAYTWGRARAQAGAAHRALGQTAAARQALTEAVDSFEKQRQQVADDDQGKQSFLSTVLVPFAELLAVEVADHRAAAAFTLAERAKARNLLDVWRSGRANPDKAMTAAERDEENHLLDELTKWNAQLTRAKLRQPNDTARLEALQKQVAAARLAQTEFEQRLYAAHPVLALQRGTPPPFTLAQAAALLPEKLNDARTALLEYAVTPEGAYLFVVTRLSLTAEPRLQVYELPIKRAELQTRVAAYRNLLATRNLLFRTEAAALYQLLIQPARAQLQGCTQLIIVPDASLWELPFQTLQSPTQHYLIEDFALSLAPSLAVLTEMKRQRSNPARPPPPATLLAFGNPSLGGETDVVAGLRGGSLQALPQAEAEIKAIARLYGAQHSRVYIGDEAREDRLKSEAGNYRVIHLASHSLLNNEQPMYSQIVLAQTNNPRGEDGLLEAWELAQLDLRADLVVLSACDTARGKVRAGEGMIGLSWALFVAGAPAVVVSQWQVDAGSTTDLMVAFHRRLVQSPAASKAVALRGAALEMLRGKYRHPFYWAGFVLVGNGF